MYGTREYLAKPSIPRDDDGGDQLRHAWNAMHIPKPPLPEIDSCAPVSAAGCCYVRTTHLARVTLARLLFKRYYYDILPELPQCSPIQ
jgi:hypothetical protein